MARAGKWQGAGLLLLGFGLWLSATPYMGIDHDARLYVLMALRHLTPAAYAQDPWFAWGSQDAWSFYSPLLARVLVEFGVQQAALLMTMLQGTLFVLAAACLCRAWLRGPSAMLAFLLLVSLPLCYSPLGMLTVSEGFVTARGLAVPLSMLALANLRRQPLLALVLHLAALSMHPIMGLGPALVSLLLYPPRRVSVGLALAGCSLVVALLAAALAGWVPLLDGEWYDYVEPARLVFIAPWITGEASWLILVFMALILAAFFGSRRTRPLYAVVSVVGGGGLLVSLLASVVPVLIVLQAQIWRTFWVCLVVALVAVADLAGRHIIRRHAPWRWLWILLLGALMLLHYLVDETAAAAAVLVLAGSMMSPALRQRAAGLAELLRLHRRWLLCFVGALALLLLPSFMLSLELAASSVAGAQGWLQPVEGLFRSGGFGLLGLSTFFLLRRMPSLLPVALLFPASFLAAGYWDVRSPIQRDQEMRYSVDGGMNPLAQWISRGDVVYWHQHPERVWMQLGTAGYASTTHCTGLVFSRERTRVLSERMVSVAARGMSRADYVAAESAGALRERGLAVARPVGDGNPMVLAGYEARVAATPFGLQQMCRDVALRWVIDTLRIDGAYAASFREVLGGVSSQLYLYDCRALRVP